MRRAAENRLSEYECGYYIDNGLDFHEKVMLLAKVGITARTTATIEDDKEHCEWYETCYKCKNKVDDLMRQAKDNKDKNLYREIFCYKLARDKLRSATMSWYHIDTYQPILISQEIQIYDVEIEKPLITNSKYLQGILDCLISFKIYQKTAIKIADDWLECHSTDEVGKGQILVELKPRLQRISQIMGQINTYLELKDSITHAVILTFDQNKTFDSLLETQGFPVFRVTKEECITEQLDIFKQN